MNANSLNGGYRAVTSDTIIVDLKARAAQLRDELSSVDAKRAELACIEKMLAASGVDVVASTVPDNASGHGNR